MRRVIRPDIVPKIFSNPAVTKLKDGIANFYKDHDKPGFSQRKPPTTPPPKQVLQEMLSELDKVFHGRCAYCEGPVDLEKSRGYDHFRPRFGARGLQNEYSPLHYWFLAFEWQNMYLSCEECNKRKGIWFPVKGKRSKSHNYKIIQKEEYTFIVDPCDKKFENWLFSYQEDGTMHPNADQRAQRTIDILGLNRKPLIMDRKKALAVISSLRSRFEKLWREPNPTPEDVLQIVTELSDYLSRIFNDENRIPYLTIQQAFVDMWISPWFGGKGDIYNYFIEEVKPRYLSAEMSNILGSEAGAPLRKIIRQQYGSHAQREWNKNIDVLRQYSPTDTGSIYLDKIVVKNFKGINEISVNFPVSTDNKESWLMLLGENSVGKSSFLQAVALALAGNSYLQKLDKAVRIRPTNLLRHGEHKGIVEIFATSAVNIKKSRFHLGNRLSDPVVLDLDKDAVYPASNLKKPGTFVFGYGSTRLFATKKLRPERSSGRIRIMNLFDPGTSLIDAQKWLVDIKDKKLFDRIARALKELLLLRDEDLIVRERGKVYICFNAIGNTRKKVKARPKLQQKNLANKVTLDELSDGYKSVLAVAADMMQTLISSNIPIESAEGIVLLDEIGTHLHPRWRMEVVRQFRDTFPKLQFLVTTHDPLCLRGLKKGEVVVLKKDEQNNVFVVKDLPDPSEFRADQLLSSEFFGLNSTVDPDLEKEFNEYYELLRKEDRLTKKETDKLNDLKEKLTGKRHLGNSLREELAFGAVDQLLADNMQTPGAPTREVLKESVASMVQEMWNEIINNRNYDQTESK